MDYLSLKVTQTTLEKAVKEMQRKISIKQREIENVRGELQKEAQKENRRDDK